MVVATEFDSYAHPTISYVFSVGLFAQLVRAQIEGWDVQWILIYLSLMFLLPKIESSVTSYLDPDKVGLSSETGEFE